MTLSIAYNAKQVILAVVLNNGIYEQKTNFKDPGPDVIHDKGAINCLNDQQQFYRYISSDCYLFKNQVYGLQLIITRDETLKCVKFDRLE